MGEPRRELETDVITRYVEGESPTALADEFQWPVRTLMRRLKKYAAARRRLQIYRENQRDPSKTNAHKGDAIERTRKINHKVLVRLEALLDDPTTDISTEELKAIHHVNIECGQLELAIQDRKKELEQKGAQTDGKSSDDSGPSGDTIRVIDPREPDRG